MSLLTLYQLNLQAGGGVSVSPDTATLTLSTFAPLITVSDHKTVIPSTATLTLSTFAPSVTVSSGSTLVPGAASLVLTTFAPTVTASNHQTVTPGTASLSLATFAPTVTVASASVVVTPGTATLTLTPFAPIVTGQDTATGNPGYANLFRDRQTYRHYTTLQVFMAISATVRTARAAQPRAVQKVDIEHVKRAAVIEAERSVREHQRAQARAEEERLAMLRQIEDDEELIYAASILFMEPTPTTRRNTNGTKRKH